jgi:hypothetical protein
MCGTDDKIVKVAAHLESIRLFGPSELHGLEAGRSDQSFDVDIRTAIVGRIEEGHRLCAVTGRREEIG